MEYNLIESFDISKLRKLCKKYEQQIKELQKTITETNVSNNSLKMMIKNSNDIFVLVNEKGEQFFISDSAERISGYTVDELFGQIKDVIYPDDRHIIQQHWEKVITTTEKDTVQYRHKHKEKGYVWLEAVAQNFIEHKDIKAVVSNIRDITERKIIEQSLKESEEKLAKIIEHISDGLVVFDSAKKIIIWNRSAEKITGLLSKDTIGENITDILYKLSTREKKDKTFIEQFIYDIVSLQSSEVFNNRTEFEIELPNKSLKIIERLIFRIDVDKNFLYSYLFRDITERKRIERENAALNVAKEILLKNEIKRKSLELKNNQKSLMAATLKLIQNSERDVQTIEKLKQLKDNANPAETIIINSLIVDYKHKSFQANWNEFEILFEKVHSSFYLKLIAQFPNLTPNELKVSAFLKLNMKNKDISHITFQSDAALKKARLRLRKKLGIDRTVNLNVFLQSI